MIVCSWQTDWNDAHRSRRRSPGVSDSGATYSAMNDTHLRRAALVAGLNIIDVERHRHRSAVCRYRCRTARETRRRCRRTVSDEQTTRSHFIELTVSAHHSPTYHSFLSVKPAVPASTSRDSPRRFYSAPQCSHCKRCISYSISVRLSVCLSVTRRYCVKTTARSMVQFALSDRKMF